MQIVYSVNCYSQLIKKYFFPYCLKVGLINQTAAQKNLPSIGWPDKAMVTIAMNGDAFGMFLIYSLSPNATNKGLYLEVREEPMVVVPLVIERRGGNLGNVTVEWRYVGGKAMPDVDFSGTGGTLVFDGMWSVSLINNNMLFHFIVIFTKNTFSPNEVY